MKRALGTFAITMGLFATSLLGTTTAQAATDVTGPILRVPTHASFVVGQIAPDPYDFLGDGNLDFMTQTVEMEYRWTASDASGICRYSIDEYYPNGGWAESVVDYRTNATTGRYMFRADDMENSGDKTIIRINAYDCVGNKRSVERPSSWFGMWKDYGPTIPSGWARTSCVCAMGDSMLRTYTYKASLSTVYNAGGRTRHVALVMAKGPARGKASIYYDGIYVKTIDTYAATNTNRVIMWEKEVTGTANHTIKIVNQATAGRPRIDIDAYLTTYGV